MMERTTHTRIGIVNTVDIIIRAVARKFAALTVNKANTEITETVRPMFTTTDIEKDTAILLVIGGGVTVGAFGEVTNTRTRIPVLDRVIPGVITIGEAWHATGTHVRRRRVHHRLVQILAFLEFQSLINP
jgi:hypothetical protein